MGVPLPTNGTCSLSALPVCLPPRACGIGWRAYSSTGGRPAAEERARASCQAPREKGRGSSPSVRDAVPRGPRGGAKGRGGAVLVLVLVLVLVPGQRAHLLLEVRFVDPVHLVGLDHAVVDLLQQLDRRRKARCLHPAVHLGAEARMPC